MKAYELFISKIFQLILSNCANHFHCINGDHKKAKLQVMNMHGEQYDILDFSPITKFLLLLFKFFYFKLAFVPLTKKKKRSKNCARNYIKITTIFKHKV